MVDVLAGVVTDDNSDGLTLTSQQDTLPEQYLGAMTIEQRRRRFDEARSTMAEANIKSQRDRSYYDGDQLTPEVLRTLKQRGQPAIYTNRIRPAVNGILGVLEQSRVDPRAYPRNPDDEEAADICTKTLRFIADQSRFGDIKQEVADNFFVEGTGAVIVEMVDNKIVPTQIRFEEFYYDPYARRADLEDARYMGIAKWMDADELTAKYKVRIDDIGDPMRPQAGGVIGEMYEDRPANMAWVDVKRRRVMLIEEYAVEEGGWKRIVYIAAGILEFGESPYVEYMEGGQQRPCCPIIAQSCYVDRLNQRYGIVRDMIPIQDEVNASRSRSLHLMNSRKVQNVDPNAPPVDSEVVRQEASRADGVLPQGWQEISNNEMTNANLMRMQEAKSEIERMGPTPAIIGRGQADSASGRSKQVSQQAGMTELARPLGRLGAWELRVYRQAWFRAQQFWTEPMWIRITDNVRAPEFCQVNEPVPFDQVLQSAMQGDEKAIEALGQIFPPEMLQAAEQGDQMAVAMIQQYAAQNGQQPIMMQNRLAEMDVDIILDTVPDTATLQEEVWAELRELASSGMSPLSPEFELLLEMSPLADKPRLLERLKSFREEAQQGQAEQAAKVAQMEEEARQLAKQQAEVDVAEKASKIQLNEANANKINAETMGAVLQPVID